MSRVIDAFNEQVSQPVVMPDAYTTFVQQLFGIGNDSDKIVIKRVMFNGPATIVFWKNGDKTVVKCHEDDHYDRKIGFMYACTKRICELGGFGKPSKVNRKAFDSWMNAWCGRKAICYDNTQQASK